MDAIAAPNFKDEEVKKLMQNLKDGNLWFFFSTSDCFSHTALSGLGDSLQQKHKIAQRKKLVSVCMHFSSEMWEKDRLLVSYILSDSLDFSKAICVHKKKRHVGACTVTICWWFGGEWTDLLMTCFICLVLTYLWFKENQLLEKWEYCAMCCVNFSC